jgi:protein TonB
MLELELVSGVDISARVESRPAVVAPEPAPAPVGAEKSNTTQTAPSVAYPLPRSKPAAPASVTTAPQDSALQDPTPKDPAMVIAAYDQQISKLIAKHRFYPPLARSKAIKGNGVVRLRINRQGKIVERRMETSTGDKMLDEAALEMVRRANPLPAVPKNYPAGAFVEFLVPVAYQ